MAGGKLLILGGYGSAGLPLARLLLKETDLRLILAGRDFADFNGEYLEDGRC
jgi:hypothetical protein